MCFDYVGFLVFELRLAHLLVVDFLFFKCLLQLVDSLPVFIFFNLFVHTVRNLVPKDQALRLSEVIKDLQIITSGDFERSEDVLNIHVRK